MTSHAGPAGLEIAVVSHRDSVLSDAIMDVVDRMQSHAVVEMDVAMDPTKRIVPCAVSISNIMEKKNWKKLYIEVQLRYNFVFCFLPPFRMSCVSVMIEYTFEIYI